MSTHSPYRRTFQVNSDSLDLTIRTHERRAVSLRQKLLQTRVPARVVDRERSKKGRVCRRLVFNVFKWPFGSLDDQCGADPRGAEAMNGESRRLSDCENLLAAQIPRRADTLGIRVLVVLSRPLLMSADGDIPRAQHADLAILGTLYDADVPGRSHPQAERSQEVVPNRICSVFIPEISSQEQETAEAVCRTDEKNELPISEAPYVLRGSLRQ
jgi:hypothetical protein